MKTDIWFPLVIGDFLKFARNLTPLERGAWLNITIEMWLQDGWIDCTWLELGRYAGISEDQWDKTRQVFSRLSLGSAQVFVEDENGISQTWLLVELDKAKKRKNVSKSNGMLGGRPRKEPAGFPTGYAPGNLEGNLEKTSSPSPSHIEELERGEKPARLPRERKPSEFTPSAEAFTIFQIWKATFPNDDAPRVQTCKNIMERLKKYDREKLVFCILKYASRVKKDTEAHPDGRILTYKGSNFFGQKAYFETYTPSEIEMASPRIMERLKAAWDSVTLKIDLPNQQPSSPGSAGEVSAADAPAQIIPK